MSEQANGVEVNYEAANAPAIPTTADDYKLAEVVIANWCVRGDKRKTRQLIAEGISLARSPSPVGTEDIVEVLRFYADPTNWSVGGEFLPASADSEYRPDAGDRARAALEAIQSIAPRTAVDERPDFSRLTLRANIERIVREYRDAHSATLVDKIMGAVPRLTADAPAVDAVAAEREDEHISTALRVKVANALANADLDGPDPEDYWDYLALAAIRARSNTEIEGGERAEG